MGAVRVQYECSMSAVLVQYGQCEQYGCSISAVRHLRNTSQGITHTKPDQPGPPPPSIVGAVLAMYPVEAATVASAWAA
jgi:hypothetical protein